MKYFENINTVEELKKQYKKLALQMHPDRHRNGSQEAYEAAEEAFKVMNGEYMTILESFDKQTSTSDNGKTYTYYYNEQKEQEVVNKIYETASIDFPASVSILLVGVYIWILGIDKNDKVSQNAIKNIKYAWHSKRKMWYWKPAGQKSSYSKKGFGEITAKYGVEKIIKQHEEKQALKAA